MKKILMVYTGGTICSFLQKNSRTLDVSRSKRVIIDNFEKSDSEYSCFARELFEDSRLEISTLSENMTLEKLNCIIDNIRSFNLKDYAGVIVLHGTDTLAYTSSLFSLAFHRAEVPIMIVSANRPPNDPLTNANDNFKTAVDLIEKGIAPNVYVPYRNSDKKMRLYMGSTLIQCANFSEDFYSASDDKVFLADDEALFEKCKRQSVKNDGFDLQNIKKLKNNVLCIKPYVGIDYKKINLKGVRAIVHGTFHSGTVCVERNKPEDKYSRYSILYLAKRCKRRNIPMYIAPTFLDEEQYSSTYDAVFDGGIIPLYMTLESAYAKLLIGIYMGHSKDKLKGFMDENINGEKLNS